MDEIKLQPLNLSSSNLKFLNKYPRKKRHISLKYKSAQKSDRLKNIVCHPINYKKFYGVVSTNNSPKVTSQKKTPINASNVLLSKKVNCLTEFWTHRFPQFFFKEIFHSKQWPKKLYWECLKYISIFLWANGKTPQMSLGLVLH